MNGKYVLSLAHYVDYIILLLAMDEAKGINIPFKPLTLLNIYYV